MANKKISELQSRTPALSDLMLVGDPSSGYSYKCTVTALATIIETDIADGYVTIGTTQTISGAKTFSNNLTLTSVVNTPTDPDKFLTLNASNVVTYRTGAEVLSDIGGVGGSGTTNYLPKFSATTTLANSQIFDNGTNIGIATATPDATARVQINKTDGYGLYLNYNTSAGSGVTTTALYAINTTASSGYAAVIEEKTPNTTAGQYPFVIKHSLSSGTAGVGFGTGVHFQLLDDAGTSKTTQLTIENIDAAAATYKTRYRFNVQNNGSSTPVVYINGTGLGVFTASPSVALDVTGEGKFSTINNATTDTDRFLVSDSGVLKYRTGAEVLSDIGGQGALTLTTSGSSGAATLVGNTLNIPNYGSALSGYVPYTGATTNVNLGTRYLQANYLVVDGQSNATGINFKQYSSVSFNGDGYTAMGPVSVDKMFFNFAQGSNIFKIFYFDVSGITGNATRAYTMPNSDGTLALTSQIPTVSGTTNYIPKFTSSSAIGNSQIFDNGTSVGIGVSTINVESKLSVAGGAIIVSGNTGTDRQVLELTTSSGVSLLKASYVGTSSFGDLAFSTGGSERMRLTSGGELGLGTSSPNSNLTIQQASTSATLGIRHTASGNGYGWRFATTGTTTNDLIFSNEFNGSFTERMRLDASGNLLVGTTSNATSAKAVIEKSSGTTDFGDNNATLFLSAGAATTTANLLRFNGAIAKGLVFGRAINADDFIWAFTNSSTPVMRLDASGNLGLGVTPSAWGSGQALQVTSAALWGFNNNAHILANAYYNSGFKYLANGVAALYEQNTGQHIWYNAPSGVAGNSISFTQAMTLDASGNLMVGGTSVYGATITSYGSATRSGGVGIRNSAGTAAGGFYTYAAGSGGGSTDITVESTGFMQFVTASAERMRITSVGNVGIGTTSPTKPLHIYSGDANGNIYLTRASSSEYMNIAPYYTVVNGNDYLINVSSSNNLRLFTNDTERMRITSGGQILMGTTSAQSGTRLQVAGVMDVWSSANTLLRFNHDGSRGVIETFTGGGYGNTAINPNGGNVGIGTTSPSNKLTVAGNIEQTSTANIVYTNNIAVVSSSADMLLEASSANIRFNSGSTERMRITSGGELLINTTSDAGDYKLQVNGNIYTNGYLSVNLNDIWIQSAGQGILSPNASRVISIQNGAVEIGGTIKTAAPSGGTAKPWKLGEAGVTLGGSNTSGVRVEIDGVVYYLVTGYLP